MTSFRIGDYLLIELVNVVAGLPLSLNVDGVVLNTLSCGHDWLSTRRIKKGIFIRQRFNKSLERKTNRAGVSRWG
jgi:hypothetical protein